MNASDKMPRSRFARASELSLLGARISSGMLRTKALEWFRGEVSSEQQWDKAHLEAAADLVQTLGRMRGVAAKFGQMLAQRPGTLPEQYIEMMFSLANQAPPMPYPMVKTQFLHEFGQAPTRLFADFARKPVAAASFGQVHRARLADGREVAVKVQYPAIDHSVKSDLDNLLFVINSARGILDLQHAAEAFDEVRLHVERELDYRLEAENLTAFGQLFRDDPSIVIPRVIAETSRRKVLTMDFLDGVDLRVYLATNPTQASKQEFAFHILRFGWISIFRHGFLHADPNPGNFLFLQDGRLGVVDFGCVKKFKNEELGIIKQLVRAGFSGDDAQLEEAARAARLINNESSPSQQEAVLSLLRLWGEPFSAEEFDFGDRTYLEKLLQFQNVLKDALGEREAVPVPPEWVFYGRHIIGTTYLLHKLGAHGNFGRALLPYLESGK